MRYGKNEIPLREGTYIVGRTADSDVRLDSATVSRRHARLVVKDERVMVEDLASRNGVFVNGVLIQRALPLEQGDKVRLGDQELELVVRERRDSERRATLGNIPRVRPEAHTDPPPIIYDSSVDDEFEESTTRADPFELLSSIVDRALAGGDASEAEALVSGHLQVLLTEARSAGTLKPESCRAASGYALKLAASTGKGSWLDYIFDLYLTARQVLPLGVVHELFAISSGVRATKKVTISRYVQLLRQRQDSPEIQLIVQRLERYERL